jgi:ferredoxin-type protein NapH
MTAIAAHVENAHRVTRTRARLQSLLWASVPLVIIGGQFWPYLGFIVPVAMLLGMVGGLFRGRWTCGWLCPRGGFFERVMGRLSFHLGVPRFLRGYPLRWTLFALLMGFMVYRLSLNPGSAAHWGSVFVLMCTITTAVGLVLGVLFQPRTWCLVCPVGTFAGSVGGHKQPLTIGSGCVGCRRCEKVCPLSLEIAEHAAAGQLGDRDCLRCQECIKACPKRLLELPKAA